MTPIQRAMCDECAAMMREFYKLSLIHISEPTRRS